jgi:alcohol dehydrogenase/propanol-preferring alcohol dehydrogenase
MVCEGLNQPLKLRETDVPKPKSGEVLVRIRACGVCHSDVNLADGTFPIVKFPRVLGHEVTGEIAAVGSGVPKSMVGLRVGMPWTYSTCRQCRQCLRGEEVLCDNARATGVSVDGGYADYMVAPADFVTRIPDELDFAEAAPLFCAGLTTFKALKIAGLLPGKKVAIIGIGGLGHLAVQFARYMGAEVIAATSTPEKEHLARELGAHYTINTREKSLVRELKYLGGVDVILSTVWSVQETENAIYGLAPDGTLVMVGVPSGNISVPPDFLLNGRRRIMASPTGSRHDLKDLLDFCVLHNITPLIEKHSLESAEETHQRLRRNEPRFRDVLIMD